MNTKPFLATFILAVALATPVFAQYGMKTKSDDEKTKTRADGTTTKIKMADDGKIKVKGKSDAGDKMKSKTKPRKGDMTGSGDGMNMGSGTVASAAMTTAGKDIVDNAIASPDHTTLVAALKAAGLVETLKSTGPFTVFAPTNAAFDKLPAGTVASLVTPEMKPTLTTILTYHVVPGRLMAADLKNGQMLTTVEGEMLTVMVDGSGVMLRDAKGGMSKVTTPNLVSSNGVIHVVDTVLMPAN